MIRILLCTCVVAGLAGLLEARTWTSPDGRKLEGEYVSSTGTDVTLKLASSGKELTFPLTKLCEEDQVFIKEQAAMGEDEKPAVAGTMRPAKRRSIWSRIWLRSCRSSIRTGCT